MRSERVFLILWTLAVLAATSAFILHLGLRVKSVELGYELGRAHARVERLREVKHVLRETSALYYATNLDGTFFLDELADSVEQCWRELLLSH